LRHSLGLVDGLMCFKNLEACPFHVEDEKPNTAFVLMPFAKQFDEVYLKGIKAGLPTGWNCNRSDERWDIPEAVCKTCKSIQEATMIIADITGRNPNVFLELGLAFGLGKMFLLVTQSVNDMPFDVRTFNAIVYDFDALDDLHSKLRAAVDQLKPAPRLSKDAFVFEKTLEAAVEILQHHASHVEHSGPTMQVFIGSKNVEQDWLLPSAETIRLLQCAPRFLFRDVKGRHDYYDFQPRYEHHFLRILKNGFIVATFPSAQWDRDLGIIYIHEVVTYIAELYLFACRVMKKREVVASQRIKVELLNVNGYPVRLDSDGVRSRGDYDFPANSIVLEEDFNPDSDWKSLFDILVRIYRAVCGYAGITDITDQIIKTNLRELLGWINELQTTYSDAGVEALNLNEVFEN
jgi:hypothetical protein